MNAPFPTKTSTSWSLCPSRPAQWQRHNVSSCRQAQTRAELRLCRPVSCSSASVSVTYSQNVAERTTLCAVAAVPSQPFPRRVFSAAPVVCHLSVGVDWPIQVACCSLPLTFSASADFLALTCLSLLSLDWTGHVQRFLGQRSEGSEKIQGRSTWEQFKRWFVLWQFSSFVWSFGALTSGCWASWAHVSLPMVLESRAQSCVGNTWWSKPLEQPDSSWHCSFSLMLYWHPSS